MKASEFKQTFPEVPNNASEDATPNSIELNTQYLVPNQLKADFYQYLFSITFTLYGLYKVKVSRIHLEPYSHDSEKGTLVATVLFKGTKL